MLTALADVVFLVDNSSSDSHATKDWLNSIVDQMDSSLRTANFDVRYGLVAFGEQYGDLSGRFAHSEVVDTDTSRSVFERLFSSGATAADHLSALHSALDHLIFVERGGEEDGWDAIDHAISEYDFRPGSVPVFVLVQNGEGRIAGPGIDGVNNSLTHDGILAALKGKNVILDSLVVDDGGALFRLSPYEVTTGDFANISVLGVEPSLGGNGQHEYHAFDTSTNAVTTSLPATQSDALQISYNGSNTSESGLVDTGKSVLIGQRISGGIGPSAAGYRAKSVPFSTVDMTTGTTTITAGNPVAFPVASGFRFYGTMYGGTGQQQIIVNQDGTITFGSVNASGDNVDLSGGTDGQSLPTMPMIAALWDDLTVGTIKRKSVDVDQDGALDLVIQWENTRYVGDNSDFDAITFQAVLFADGRIQLNYVDLDSYSHLNAGSPPTPDSDATVRNTGGISATIGIWSGSPDPVTLPAGAFVPGLHSVFGAFGATSGEANDSYVRMAWDTGGAAWDISVVQTFGITSDAANALRDTFIASLSKQIADANAAGRVARSDNVLYAFNLGDSVTEGMAADPFTSSLYSSISVSSAIDKNSNSIPEYSTGSKFENVFRSAKVPATVPPPGQQLYDIALSFTPTSFPGLTDGRYIVELFFSEIASLSGEYTARAFDVEIEGKTLLNNYSIYHDHSKIVDDATYPQLELDTNEAQRFTGVVKRFAVDVSSADETAGLFIRLRGEGQTKALINGIRVLRADGTRIENVVVKGSSWAKGVDYSYAEVVAAGNQHRPIYLQNANQIEVHFDAPVNLSSAQLDILGSNRVVVKTSASPSPTITLLSYNPTSFVATWSLNSALTDGKYALKLSGVKGSGGLGLDGGWKNFDGASETSHTPDNFGDDKKVHLLTGTGNPGEIFEFHFSVLPGDYNQDGIVDPAADTSSGTLKDGNGDGQINSQDSALVTNVYPLRQLPFRVADGDYQDTELVNGVDYTVWLNNWGYTVTPFTVADGNGDGVVGSGDYPLWRTHVGKYSAWYTGTVGAAVETVVDFGNAPRVGNVTIRGSGSTHNPYSFATHVGSGEQLLTVPVGGADTISITFSEDVNVAASNLFLVGLTTANVPVLAEFSYDIATMTATWRFESLNANDNYVISLSDAVTDIEGNRLDGEWVNPATISTTNALVSEFPSGDGNAGGRFNFVFTLLAGDANLNTYVTFADFQVMYAHYGTTSGMLFADGDFNGDGGVTFADYQLLSINYGRNLQSVWLLGDLNNDFVVDDSDVNTISDNIGMSNPTHADGDLNADGSIDAADLDLMFAQYGLNLAVVS